MSSLNFLISQNGKLDAQSDMLQFLTHPTLEGLLNGLTLGFRVTAVMALMPIIVFCMLEFIGYMVIVATGV